MQRLLRRLAEAVLYLSDVDRARQRGEPIGPAASNEAKANNQPQTANTLQTEKSNAASGLH